MQDQEYLLTNYYLIYEMLNVGLTIKQITTEINKLLNTNTAYRQVRYLINRVQNKSLHKEYDNIVMINNFGNSTDAKLDKFCVNFKGLLITYKSALRLSSSKSTIVPDNLINVSSKESLLYAKRILKLYHISDRLLIDKHKLIYPNQSEIDLKSIIEQININFNNEFNNMLLDLRNKYVHFIANNLQEQVNE